MSGDTANKVGRPSKYDPAFCGLVIELGKGGASKAEMCLEMDISYMTFERWQEAHPEFCEAVKDALRFSQGWWEKEGRINTFGGEKFNATSFIFNMKNRFKDEWSDMTRSEVTGKDGGSIKTEEVGSGSAKVLAALEVIAERSRAAGNTDA